MRFENSLVSFFFLFVVCLCWVCEAERSFVVERKNCGMKKSCFSCFWKKSESKNERKEKKKNKQTKTNKQNQWKVNWTKSTNLICVQNNFAVWTKMLGEGALGPVYSFFLNFFFLMIFVLYDWLSVFLFAKKMRMLFHWKHIFDVRVFVFCVFVTNCAMQ